MATNTHRQNKWCEKHQCEKTVADKCPDCLGGIYWRCPECNRERWRYQNSLVTTKLRQRAWSLKKNYGITPEEYQAMHDAQNGVCAICRRVPNSGGKNGKVLLVDHNPSTGKVRGLLCHPCNKMLGDAFDNSEVLELGAQYLVLHS